MQTIMFTEDDFIQLSALPHYSSAKVHRSVQEKVKIKDGITEPKSIDDYHIPTKQDIEKELPGLECEVIDGE